MTYLNISLLKEIEMGCLTEEQTELLYTLARLWHRLPEQRFGQLLFNFTRFQLGQKNGKIDDIFHYSDEEILSDLKRAFKDYE